MRTLLLIRRLKLPATPLLLLAMPLPPRVMLLLPLAKPLLPKAPRLQKVLLLRRRLLLSNID